MKVKEIVIYSINEGTDVAAYKIAAKRAEGFLAKQPGYHGRELLFNAADNQWIDLVHWDDMQSAQNAAKLAMGAPECQEFFGMIVHESAKMLHAERVDLP